MFLIRKYKYKKMQIQIQIQDVKQNHKPQDIPEHMNCVWWSERRMGVREMMPGGHSEAEMFSEADTDPHIGR